MLKYVFAKITFKMKNVDFGVLYHKVVDDIHHPIDLSDEYTSRRDDLCQSNISVP